MQLFQKLLHTLWLGNSNFQEQEKGSCECKDTGTKMFSVVLGEKKLETTQMPTNRIIAK